MPRAKIVPCFPSGTLKSDEQQSTVAERPLLPLSSRPELLEDGVGSVSLFRPAWPILVEGVAGTIARYRSLTGPALLTNAQTLRRNYISSVSQTAKACPTH